MKIYEQPIAKVIMFENNDILTNSEDSDNLGGVQDGWGGVA